MNIKYIHLTNKGDIRYFDSNVKVSDFIDLAQYRLMTDEEIDHHENPEKYYTDEEKRAAYLASLPNLSKRQFNLYLYDNQRLDDVNNLLANNPRFKIEFDSTDTIVRTSSTVDAMITLLGWTNEQVDSMWEEALTL